MEGRERERGREAERVGKRQTPFLDAVRNRIPAHQDFPAAHERVLAVGRVHEVDEVPHGAAGDLGQGFVGEESLVAAHDDVGEGHEAHEGVVLDDLGRVVVVEEAALGLVHVEGQAAEVATLEGGDDGLGVDEAAARRVDQDGALLHLGQRVLVDDVARRLHEGAVQADEVALGQQGVQVGVLAELLELGDGEGVVGEHAAAVALHDAGQGEADLAHAQHADRLAVQRAAQQAVEVEVALAHAVVGPVRLAVERLQQGHGELGHGLGAVAGHVGHEEAQLVGCRQVHVVEARAPKQHRPHALLVQRLQHLG